MNERIRKIVVYTLFGAIVLAGATTLAQRPGSERRTGPITPEPISLKVQSATLRGAPGSLDTIDVTIDSRGSAIGGFDLTFAYDAIGFELVDALPGAFLDSCNWEYFYSRKNPVCPGPCPSGLFKVVALAESQDTDSVIVCFLPPKDVSLLKLVLRRRPVESRFKFSESLRFFWIDCGDNSVASVSGDELFLAKAVTEPNERPLPDSADGTYPTYAGPGEDCFGGRVVNAPQAKLLLENAVITLEPVDLPVDSL